MNEINELKESLRIVDACNISSEIIDDVSCVLKFTYNKRNYILSINKEYKFMLLNTTHSIYGVDINIDTIDLIDFIETLFKNTQFEGYNILAIAFNKTYNDNYVHKIFQVIKPVGKDNAIIDIEEVSEVDQEITKVDIEEYDFGLNNFDKRVFISDWQEDFNEKIITMSDEDLYIMYTTLSSYLYKLVNNKWEDAKIDPYLVPYFTSIIYDEVLKRIDNRMFEDWFLKMSESLDDEKIKKYLSKK